MFLVHVHWLIASLTSSCLLIDNKLINTPALAEIFFTQFCYMFIITVFFLMFYNFYEYPSIHLSVNPHSSPNNTDG